jgi:hypothetical protein
MFLSNLKAVVLVLVATGGSTIGLLALTQRGPAQPQPATPAAVAPGSAQPQPRNSTPAEKIEQGRLTKIPKWRTLAAARIDAAREILNQSMRLWQAGEASFADAEIATWSHRLMEGRLSLATTSAEHLAAIQEHRERMKEMERRARVLFERGQVPESEVLAVRYFRLEADQLLAEAGVDPDKDVSPAQPKPAQGSPPRSPPPAPSR